MKLFTHKIYLAVGIALLSNSTTVNAFASASANINWGSLTIQYFDLSDGSFAPSLVWTAANGEVYSRTVSADPYDLKTHIQKAEDFSQPLSTNTQSLYALSSTLRTVDELNAYATTESSISNSFELTSNHASAESFNYGDFQLTGKGIALLRLDWSAAGIGSKDNALEYANVRIGISGIFSDNNGSEGDAFFRFEQSTNENGSFSESETFSMAIFTDGLHTVSGSFSAAAIANSYSPVSQVPIPTTLGLFISGLLGMLHLTCTRKVA